MKIRLNGEPLETEAASLLELVRTLGYEEGAKIATAMNGDFVPREARAGCALIEGAEIEIVAPRQGG